ncbi:hypothetical protein SAMN05428969_3270 [Devosia sp. YR412]|uniref:hypothetical protein n=1 Tax=Devosia sp. YR412 TaxID=1881030 RepID=UPI0008B21324|nr:hypothetical protein [Devosia sp. YR412]SEQ49314.1 hypothetical protein SAMN05428969_3270 [Devosia sp. YR412]
MWDAIKKNVVRPMAERLGTIVATSLVPFGVHADSAGMLTIGIIGVGLVAVDLIAARFNRKAIEKSNG